MKYLLDTNVWIALLASNANVEARVAQIPLADIALCDVVKAELLYGAYKSQRVQANCDRLTALFSRFNSLPFDEAAAWQFGQIRAALEAQGRTIGPYDLQIAAIGKAYGLKVVTANTGEFERVDGLAIENWVVG